MVIHSVEETQPRSYRLSHHWMSRLRDFGSSMWRLLTELVGGNDELAVSVPQIKFVGGMRMTEIVKDLKLTGCEQITLDTCTCVVYCEYASRFERYHQLGFESIDCR
jgi:hypothetical protein